MDPNSNQNQVIFDGDCKFCTALKDFSEDKTDGRALNFIPLQSSEFDEVAPHLTRGTAEKALYVITSNGKQLRGSRAVFEIMRELPGVWGVIGKILGTPPIYWLAEPFYRWFAKHRHEINKFL